MQTQKPATWKEAARIALVELNKKHPENKLKGFKTMKILNYITENNLKQFSGETPKNTLNQVLNAMANKTKGIPILVKPDEGRFNLSKLNTLVSKSEAVLEDKIVFEKQLADKSMLFCKITKYYRCTCQNI